MANPVNLTIDGKAVSVPAGTLLIEAARKVGIEVPAFCYYEGYSLQGACRMCLVEIEKNPKLQAGCLMTAGEGMVVRTESPKVVEARKSNLEFLLTNHPLDCPVCDKGGECELQDMVFRYGAGESRFTEIKHHVDEKQFSPLVFFDAPRCILCYRCVRVCEEGMGVQALGVVNRGVITEIAPSHGDHLECDECGMCIDICPVGALTSGAYRYKSRPWEMNHVGTVCTHCADGCKTTLALRNQEIIRANNRDRSGLNGEFLCVKGRFGWDFVASEERLRAPLVRKNGELVEASWSEALALVANKFSAVKAAAGRFGVIGSTHASNEENYFLQKFARQGLGTANIDHRRSGDVITLLDALSGRTGALATLSGLSSCKAALLIGCDLSQQHPLLAFQLRANNRLRRMALYTANPGPSREDDYAAKAVRGGLNEARGMADDLKQHADLVILYGDSVTGGSVRELVAFGDSLGIPVKYVCLVDDSNSRGAIDMGMLPDGGRTMPEMLAGAPLDVLWIVGEDPGPGNAKFLVVHDLFLTGTAKAADVVFPSASAYEKSGTVTNVTGEVQRLKPGPKVMGTKTDLEIMGLLAKGMGLDLGIWTPGKVFEEIRATVRGYNVAMPVVATGGAAPTSALNGRVPVSVTPELFASAGDTLFTSGTLGRYSQHLKSVLEAPGQLYGEK